MEIPETLFPEVQYACEFAAPSSGAHRASIELSARQQVRAQISTVAKAIASGQLDEGIEDCYYATKEYMMQAAKEERQARCALLAALAKPEVMAGSAVKLAVLDQDFQAYRIAHAVEYTGNSNGESAMRAAFLNDFRTAYCSESDGTDRFVQFIAADAALKACM
jgi:hypothetical protein